VLDGWIGMSPFGASMLDKYEGNSSVGASSMLSVPESGAQQTVSASASILDSCNCESGRTNGTEDHIINNNKQCQLSVLTVMHSATGTL
jgi:hypothetical protein